MPDDLLPADVPAISVNPETGQTATAADLAVLNPPPTPSSFYRRPEDTTGFFTSIKDAFLRESITKAGVDLITDSRGFEQDPDFVLKTSLDKRKDQLGPMFQILGEKEQMRLADIESEEELDFVLGRMQEDLDLSESAGANGFLPYLIGGMGSVFLDPVSLLTLGPVTKAYTAWRVGSRLGSAGRGALLTGADAGLREAILQNAQVSRTPEESIMAIGIGTALGAGIGGAFPGRINGTGRGRLPKTTEEINNHPLNPDFDDVGEVVTSNPEDLRTLAEEGATAQAGGAAAADPTLSVPGRSGGRLLNFATPLGRAIQRSRVGQKLYGGGLTEVSRQAAEATGRDFSLVSRLIETHVVTSQNEKGIATGASVERIAKDLKSALIVRTDRIMNIYAGAMNDGSLRFRLTSKNANISRVQFDTEIRRFRLSQARGQKYAPLAELQTSTLQGGDQAFLKAVKKGAAAEQEFYDGFQKQMIDGGMIRPEDAVENYMPQVYNREAIAQSRQEFAGLLRERFLQRPDDDWLADNGFDGTWDELRQNDPGAAADAANEWSVAAKADAERFANEELDAAQAALVDAKVLAKSSGKQSTAAKREAIARGLTAARAKSKEFRARLERERVARDEQAATYEKLFAHLAALQEQSALVREGLVPFVDGKPVILHGIDENGARFSRAPTKPRVSGDTIPVAAKQIKGNIDDVKWLEAPDEVTQRQFGGQTRRMGEIEGATKQLARRLEEADRRMLRLRQEGERLEAKTRGAEAAAKRATEINTAARRSTQAAQRALKSAEKRLAKAEGKVRVASGRKTLPEQVDAVMTAMLNHRITPHGILPDDVVGASGRSKARTIDWGNLILDPRLEKFLRTDIDSMASSFADDISPRLALRQVFGEESMKAEIEEVTESYARAIQTAIAAGDDKTAVKLRKDMNSFERDVPAMRDKELGVYRLPEDPNSAMMWGIDNLRNFNFLRSMGKVLLSSITDTSIGMFATNASFSQLFTSTMRNTRKLVAAIPDDELKALLIGYENMQHYSRVARTWDIAPDQAASAGFGAEGSVARKVSSKVTAGLSSGTHLMNKVNGMSWWNKRMRITFGTIAMKNMINDLPKFAKLGTAKKNLYLRHGVDERMAKRIDGLMKSDGIDVDGVRMPNGSQWIQKDPEAFTAFKRAISETLDEAIIVPGTGDLPLLMSHPAGRLVLQFQSFAMASVNRYVRPAVQQGDSFAAMTAAISIMLAGTMYVARQGLNGNLDRVSQQIDDFAEKGDTSILFEAVTRSPLLGHLAMPLEVATRMAGGTVNNQLDQHFGIAPVPRTSRIGERSAWQIPLGPSFGTVEGFATGINSGLRLLDGEGQDEEGARFARKLTRLAPYNNVFWLQGAMNALDLTASKSRLQPDTR